MSGFALFVRYWREISIGLLLLVIGGLVMHNARVAAERNAAEARVETEQAKHTVTTASLRVVTTKLKEVTAAVNALAAGDAERMRTSRQAVEQAQARIRDNQIAIDRLRAAAARGGDPCEPSPELMELWK